MNEEKERLLYDTYQQFMNEGLGFNDPDILAGIAGEEIMGFGTAIDEKIFGRDGLYELLKRQKEQSSGIELSWKIEPLKRYITADGNAAAFADDLFLFVTAEGQEIEIYMRFSVILEYIRGKWQVIHWHGSKPENVQSEKDTYGIEDWKQRTEALEKIVAERTLELTRQKEELEQALEELKTTQTQLIQSEKMASLGELTAGIAHEIQNPLNFVNNFSEVSRELIEELKSEKATLSPGEQEEILNDIDMNLEKINHHGKRADAIVKGMLQHSRTSSGQKEPTDINDLCDEYLRLAYHGLRAKDKSFNASFETALDSKAGMINIVSQDIGRVVLNLINNAFYAVNEKKKQAGDDYMPTVTVSTKREKDSIKISVSDNGNGIPAKVLDKIFQPFFTTKPTGQGTGLGLSLAFDIVTKGHGGELKVETEEGRGTIFHILLPVKE